MVAKYKQKILVSASVFLLSFIALPAAAGACNLFNWSDCDDAGKVIYCNDSSDCSLSRGTDIVASGINDIEKNRKFSQYIQDIVAYLLMFLGIVAVLYIIYAGFNILTSGGDEEKVKKAKKTILYIVLGFVLIFFAYSIVRFVIGRDGQGGIFNNAYIPSFIETTHAYTDYDTNTFDFYKKKIELLSANLDQEYQVNGKISTKTMSELSGLVTASMNTFPDSQDSIYNTNLARSLLTSIELVKKTPDSDSYITSLAKNLNEYLNKVKIGRIKGTITASPDSGNAPLTTTLRAQNVIDPSGVTVPRGNYIWWIRAAGGGRTIIGTGPSLAYTFQEERNYTVFLTIVSASRNAKGKTDVLPFESSINVNALPKLGNLRLFINGVYASNIDKIKFTPAQGRAGIIFDVSASTPASGTAFTQTSWNFGNGNSARYSNGPGIERQIFASEWTYRVKLEVTTNENKVITKQIDIDIRNPAASIRTDKTKGFPNDEFRFSAASNYSSTVDSSYEWKIYDANNEAVLLTSNHKSISYKFLKRGDHMVRLRSIAPNGSEDIDTVIVTIEERDPVAYFDAKVASAEQPNTIYFDATKSYNPDSLDTSNLTFNWTIDGERVNLANTSRNGSLGRYTFNTTGTHKVLLEVINQEGKATTYNREVNIDSLLAVKLVVSPKIGMTGAPVTLIADSKEARAFEWQFGDGESDIRTTGRITHIYKKSGTFDVNLTVRGANSQSSNTITRKVYVMTSDSPLALITVKGDNDEIIPTPEACDGKEAFVIDRSKAITLSAENSVNIDGNTSGLTYTWKYAGKNSSQRTFSYKFDELGCFPITLTVRSQKTGKVDTRKAYVQVDNLPPKLSALAISADRLETDPVTVTVTANNAVDEDGAIVAYTWYYYTENDPEPQDFRITRTPKTVFVLPRITGKYYFAVILEDSNGMKVNSDESGQQKYSLTLTSDNINTPIISLKTSTNAASVGDKIDFAVTVKNILGNDISDKAEYKWDFNGDGFYEETTNTPKVSHVYDKLGSFNFKVKATYKGISNTKYQAITIKNEIAPNLEYIAIGKKFVFFNTTKGLYTKVKWSIDDIASSTNSSSFVYDFGDEDVTGSVKLEVSDGTDTKSITVDLKKDIVNALRTKKSADKLVTFAYPAIENNAIHIKDISEKVFIYMGESKGSITKYVIDSDINVDSNLNGNPADDIDNKGTDSFASGNPYVIGGFDTTSRERTVRLSIYDTNNTLIESKDIKLVFDSVAETTGSGALSDEISKEISEKDRADMERLKDLIKSVREQDRLKLMQYFSALQENWFDTREKTKTIIDFQNYIDSNAAIDIKTKETFYSILDGFLLADTQVKDDIALATKVLKSLIPKTNPKYSEIMKNIDEILSHPTNTPLNKELGKAILEAVKNDTTIENKDKLIIKSQLEVIIAGGQENLAETQPAPAQEETGFSIIGFITGFLKIFGFALLAILGLFLVAFIYFKVFNKQENIGFQDFLIEKLFHGGSKPQTPKAEAPVAPKKDVLFDIASETKTPEETKVEQPTPPVETSVASMPTDIPEAPLATSSEKEMAVPDWLRQSTTLPSEEVKNETVGVPDQATPAEESSPEQAEAPSDTQESALPDWLKASTTIAEDNQATVAETKEEAPSETVFTPAEQELPDWLKSMDQDSLNKEVEQELSSTDSAEVSVTPSSTSPNDDIPDWLRSASNIEPAQSEEVIEEVSPAETPQVEVTTEDASPVEATEEKKSRPKKKAPPKDESSTESDTPLKKKSKPKKDENLSAPDVVLPSDEDLPDWLK